MLYSQEDKQNLRKQLIRRIALTAAIFLVPFACGLVIMYTSRQQWLSWLLSVVGMAAAVLSSGGSVYLAPDSAKEAMPNSIKSQFSTDFWSVGTFPSQDGGMGLYIDRHHPIFKDFPTAKHADYQWWHMANQRALILPRYMDTIVAVNDSYAYLRPLAMLLECRCGGGRLLISTMGLHNLDCPEARALQAAIYRYMASDAFNPSQEIGADEVRGWIR